MKTKHTHTPGPWTFTPVSNDFRRVLSPNINEGGNWHVAMVQSTDADARLIAAAPELLEALKACLPLAEHTSPFDLAVIMARRAIAKAEGGA